LADGLLNTLLIVDGRPVTRRKLKSRGNYSGV
jgi:hypothetical protein